jgi:predicted nucleotidyltransferase
MIYNQDAVKEVQTKLAIKERLAEHERDRIIKALKKDKGIELILLFGSFARGDIRGESDIDMIIVKETTRKFLDRLDEIYSALVPNVGPDILLYTPDEFESLKKRGVLL